MLPYRAGPISNDDKTARQPRLVGFFIHTMGGFVLQWSLCTTPTLLQLLVYEPVYLHKQCPLQRPSSIPVEFTVIAE